MFLLAVGPMCLTACAQKKGGERGPRMGGCMSVNKDSDSAFVSLKNIYGVVFLSLMSLTGPSWSFHWYRQGAMTVLGGDVSNMGHHGQFERQQQEKPDEISIMRPDTYHHGQEKKLSQVVLMQLYMGEWVGLLVKFIYFLAAIIGALLPWSGYYMW